jgi:hypothetical protein
MLTRRVAHLGLLACLVATTALGLQPALLRSAFIESETEADGPGEEPGEEESKSDTGIPVRRRGTVLFPPMELLSLERRESNRSIMLPVPSSLAAVSGNRNGYGGPLRL